MEPKKEKNYNAYSEEKKVKFDICYNAYSEEKQLYHQTNKNKKI